MKHERNLIMTKDSLDVIVRFFGESSLTDEELALYYDDTSEDDPDSGDPGPPPWGQKG